MSCGRGGIGIARDGAAFPGCGGRSHFERRCALLEKTGLAAVTLRKTYRVVTGALFYPGDLCVTDAPKDAVMLHPGETGASLWANSARFSEAVHNAAFTAGSAGRAGV